MSMMGRLVFEMQENAQEMTREQFVELYGTANIAVWDEVTGFGWDEPDFAEMDDGA